MESSPLRLAPNNPAVTYRFGLFELEPSGRRLLKQGRLVRLQDQPFQLLTALVEHSGEIVTREMLRQLLWPGDTFVDFDKSLGVAVTKLRDALGDDAGSPTFVETVARHGYRFIAPVERLDRQISAPSATLSTPASSQTPVSRASVSTRARNQWLAVLALTVATFATVHYLRPRPKPPSSGVTVGDDAKQPAIVRRSIAVLGFRNLQERPEDAWLSSALSEMLSTELASTSECRLVSGEDVAQAKRDLPLADADTLSRATLLRLRTNPGADVVILGSYAVLPENGAERLRLDLRVQDTASGETISEQALVGNEQNLFELAAQAGVRLRQALGMSADFSGAPDPSRASLPSNQTALRLYTEGRAKLWAFDFRAARDLLTQSIAADPDYPLSHSALSQVWVLMDNGNKARAEAQRALELSQNLPQEQRLQIEGEYRVATLDWPKAVEAYQALFKLYPDSLDYGLGLAGAQLHSNPADCRQTLATLRRLPFPADEDPRIDLMEASAWIDMNFAKADAAAQRAIIEGKAEGSALIVARAYGILCQQASSAASSAANSMRYCQIAVERSPAEGGSLSQARNLNDFADVYFERGDIKQAEAMWRKANRTFHEGDDPQGTAATLNNIGDALLVQGDLLHAQQFLAKSIPNYREAGDKDGVALALNDEADISRLKGELDAAHSNYQKAEDTAREIGSRSTEAYALFGFGDLFKDLGDLSASRKSHEQALALRNQTGEKQAKAESQVALARLSVEEGHPADAELDLRRCIAQFHQAQQADDELIASATLIEALLAQKKQTDVKHEVEKAAPLAANSQNFLARLQFELASARASLASDAPKSSRTQFENILRQAHVRGLVGTEFEARLSLAELEEKTGHASSAQSQLASLEHDAQMKGFGLVARKAAEIH